MCDSSFVQLMYCISNFQEDVAEEFVFLYFVLVALVQEVKKFNSFKQIHHMIAYFFLFTITFLPNCIVIEFMVLDDGLYI